MYLLRLHWCITLLDFLVYFFIRCNWRCVWNQAVLRLLLWLTLLRWWLWFTVLLGLFLLEVLGLNKLAWIHIHLQAVLGHFCRLAYLCVVWQLNEVDDLFEAVVGECFEVERRDLRRGPSSFPWRYLAKALVCLAVAFRRHIWGVQRGLWFRLLCRQIWHHGSNKMRGLVAFFLVALVSSRRRPFSSDWRSW